MANTPSPLIETGDPLAVRDLINAHGFACTGANMYESGHDHSQTQELWSRVSCSTCFSDIVAAPYSVLDMADSLQECE